MSLHENDKQNAAKHRKMEGRKRKLMTGVQSPTSIAFRRTKWARRRGLGMTPKGDTRKRKQARP